MIGVFISAGILVLGPLIGVTIVMRRSDGPVSTKKKLGLTAAFALLALFLPQAQFVPPPSCTGGFFCGIRHTVRDLFNLGVVLTLSLGGVTLGLLVPDPDRAAGLFGDSQTDDGFNVFVVIGGVVLVLIMFIVYMRLMSSFLIPAQGEIANRCGGNLLCRFQLAGGGILMMFSIGVSVFIGPFVVGTILAVIPSMEEASTSENTTDTFRVEHIVDWKRILLAVALGIGIQRFALPDPTTVWSTWVSQASLSLFAWLGLWLLPVVGLMFWARILHPTVNVGRNAGRLGIVFTTIAYPVVHILIWGFSVSGVVVQPPVIAPIAYAPLISQVGMIAFSFLVISFLEPVTILLTTEYL